jgi:hypothetical protein
VAPGKALVVMETAAATFMESDFAVDAPTLSVS